MLTVGLAFDDREDRRPETAMFSSRYDFERSALDRRPDGPRWTWALSATWLEGAETPCPSSGRDRAVRLR
jgi:hypothetical protein